MGLLDNLKNKAQELANNPEYRTKLEEFAKQHNISIEEAKKRLFGENK